MNDLSPGRIIVLNGTVAVTEHELATDELFNGAYYTQQAHDLFVQARTVRHEPAMREHYHRQAMEQLDLLAEALGLELVPREEVKTR